LGKNKKLRQVNYFFLVALVQNRKSLLQEFRHLLVRFHEESNISYYKGLTNTFSRTLCSFTELSAYFLSAVYTNYRIMDYSVNDRLKEARLALKLSQRAFSKGIFLKSRGYYGDIETYRNEINERVIELICSAYGVNKAWLKTGKGKMFDKTIDSQLEEVTVLFNQLNTHFKGYVLAQIKQKEN
jgi:transcriptional regulator with XRE-family HTH domain